MKELSTLENLAKLQNKPIYNGVQKLEIHNCSLEFLISLTFKVFRTRLAEPMRMKLRILIHHNIKVQY